MNLPTQEELQALRKGLRKRKLPRIFDGMWCSEPGIGGVKVTAAGADFHVEWVSFDGGVKSAPKHAEWSRLCSPAEHCYIVKAHKFKGKWVVSEVIPVR